MTQDERMFGLLIGCFCLALGFLAVILLQSRRLWALAGKKRALEAQLEDMQKALEEKLELFRSLLSHDLRIPISIVQGYAELLAGDLVADPAAQKEYLEKIIRRTRDMSAVLTKQLVDARSGELPRPNCTPIDLIDLVRRIADDLQTTAGSRGISIQVLSTEPQIMVLADGGQMNKVFFNLVENATKYMGREGIVTIRLTRGDGMANVTVKDDGLGLSEEETGHIFELEFQGSNRSGGHGHGLYLVRRTIEAQGGDVSAHSQPGRGMSIFMTIPLAEVTAQPAVPL